MNALVIENVSHRYGATLALDGVSLSVAAGEILCLVGPSGCGKSTLLRIAAGLEPLQAGRVAIDGVAVAEAGRAETPPEARNVGFLFQDFALFPHLSVIDNAAFGLHRMAAGEARDRARAALARVGMADYARAYPHTLSGGQQQRVALACADDCSRIRGAC
jgi:iron(III) transport system ATP-binding protein